MVVTDAVRVVYAEDLRPGMVIQMTRETPQDAQLGGFTLLGGGTPRVEVFWATVLDVRCAGGVASVIVVLPDGEQDGVIHPGIMPVKVRVQVETDEIEEERA